MERVLRMAMLAAMAAGLLTSCSPAEDEALEDQEASLESGQASSPYADIYARVENQIGAADYLAPGNAREGDLRFELAPLLLIPPLPGGERPAARLGALRLTPDGTAVPVDGPPTIYVESTTSWLEGRQRQALHYQWWYRDEDAPGPPGGWGTQGVRITLDERGLPRVWEVLRDRSGARVLYVSAALEERARRRLGAPLPGRRFVLEPSLAEEPLVVVARALTDGPIPMGPWIYLLPESLDVGTLLCRCMASQAKGPLERTDYLLQAWEHPVNLSLDLPAERDPVLPLR